MTKQPRDDANDSIPVLSFRRNGGQKISFGASTTRSNAFGSSTRVVSLYSDSDCYFEVGDGTVEANLTSSHFLPAGLYIDVSLGSEVIARDNYKYISVISTSPGTLYISERE